MKAIPRVVNNTILNSFSDGSHTLVICRELLVWMQSGRCEVLGLRVQNSAVVLNMSKVSSGKHQIMKTLPPLISTQKELKTYVTMKMVNFER